ncbi:riboflavin kinase, partial [Irineochytrium annulatum]
GFGRGSKELGIPTANLPEEAAQLASRVLKSGIYYGWASLPSLAREGQEATEDRCWPMVMSFGWNPYYKNERRTAEVHILHDFPADFYGEEMRVCVAGYLRDEKDYTSVEALIEDINVDIAVAKKSLARPAYEALRGSEFLRGVGEGFTGEA